MTLNKNAQLWVEGLRSGKYSQTKGRLQDESGYCCLGVACSVYEENTGGHLPRNIQGYYGELALIEGCEVVAEWLGLADNIEFGPKGEGSFKVPGMGPIALRETLSNLNDSWSWSFEALADTIESQPEGLFE